MATKVKSNGQVKTRTKAVNRIADTSEDGVQKQIAKFNKKNPTIADTVVIRPLRQKVIEVRIVGVAPYMQNRFSAKAKQKMMQTQEAGSQAKSKKVREPRNYQQDCEGATYRLPDGSNGIPASSFRNACISACRLCGFHMTKAKLSLFCEADGLDQQDATPLVKIFGKSEMSIQPARNANDSCDLRSRPMWREWHANLRIRFDEDQFSTSDVVNLLIRAGLQVGVGEGRPDSRSSNGMNYGMFEVVLPKGM